MEGPPKLRHLPPFSSSPDSRLSEPLEAVWEIDVGAITWSIALSYLMTVPDDAAKNFLRTVLHSELSLSKHKLLATVREIKKNVRKFNPFLKGYGIRNNKAMKNFISHFRKFLLNNCSENDWHSVLQNAAKQFKCVISLYSVDSQKKCQFSSLFEPNELCEENPKLIILCHSESRRQASNLPKFNFGLPSKFAEIMRQKCLKKVLWKINLSEDEIQEIYKAISSGKNFLVCLLQSSSKTIIPALYKPPYIARKLAEVGFDVDPRLQDENGFSAFHYCMDLPETHFIWLLYNFVANMFHLKDHNIRNPNGEIRNTLKQIGRIIDRDIARARNCSPTYKKRAGQILRFNQYQREVIEETFRLNQTQNHDDYKTKIMYILKKYEEYFYFKSPLYNHTLDLNDELGLFKNFVLHSEYHENLDVFTSMMFFDQFPHITGAINETNRDIFTDTLSTIFLSILSNNFFPKYEHKSNVCLCGQQSDICEQENNAQRFVAFYYRQCFLSKAVALENELKHFQGDAQSSSTDLLETIRSSLSHLPEIADEFLIVRIKLYLEIATDCSHLENESTRMLIFERTLQVIGEVLNNKTKSKTVVRFLIGSCLPTDLRLPLIQIRHHCFAKYRASSVQGKVNIEGSDHVYLDSIHKELLAIDKVIKSVFDSQRFRVEEFLIEKCKTNAEYVSETILSKLDTNLSEIITKRKEIFLSQKGNLSCLLRALFKYAIEKLNTLHIFNDFKNLCEAINYLLKFVAIHWEEYSTVLLEIRDKMIHFISSIKSNDITNPIKLQLNIILLENLRILEGIFSNFQICESPFEYSYSVIPSLLSEMKGFDIFTPKEKVAIKEKISEFVRNSNETIQKLTKKCEEKRGHIPRKLVKGIIMPESSLSKLKKCVSTTDKMNDLHKVFRDMQHISNRTLLRFLNGDLNKYEIFSLEEKEKIKDILDFFRAHYSNMPLKKILINDSEIADQDIIIKEIKYRLNILFASEDKQPVIAERISENFESAKKILESIEQEQKIETWYKNPNNDTLNLDPPTEEHLSVLLKVSLPKAVKYKLMRILNQKVWFLINRIGHMKRLLIFEDATICSLWNSNTWKDDKDEEKHLKSLMIQRYLIEKSVKASLETLLFDCMLILDRKDLADLWKKTNNMFIGSNMIQILSHGNPLIEAAGSFLDPTDLACDLIDKILNLIEDEPVLRVLSALWVRKKICKLAFLKNYISKADNFLTKVVKKCLKWEKYLELLPLKY